MRLISRKIVKSDYYNVMSQCVKQIVCFIHPEINCCCKIQQETLPYTCIYILEKRVWYVRQICGFHSYTG